MGAEEKVMKLVMKLVSVWAIDHKETGRRARMKRREQGLTLQQVAQRMKISVAYLSALERGDRAWNYRLLDWFSDAVGE